MASALKRSIAFLLVLVLAIGMIPTAFAAEVEPTDSTTPDTHATDPPEETTSENTLPVSQTAPETISLLEDEMDYWALDNSIAVFAEAEISGAPNAFANLTLPSGGIDIPAQGYIQHKKILPLYSVYLKNQTGYANNYYVAYCIEPGVELGNTGHSGTAYTLDGMTEGSGAMYRLSREKVEAIGVALMYGQRDIASKKDEQSLRYEKLCRHAATQAIIWEIACGWRSPYPPYTLWDSTLYDAITPSLYCASSVWGTTFYLDGMDDAYRVIANQMAQHYTIPSFMKSSRSSAPSYALSPDGTGKYSITLTDTNGILSQYSFSNTSNLTFSVSGNKLTVTANAPVSDVVVAPSKQVPNLDSQVFFVWEHGTQQKLMSCKTEPVLHCHACILVGECPAPDWRSEPDQNDGGWKEPIRLAVWDLQQFFLHRAGFRAAHHQFQRKDFRHGTDPRHLLCEGNRAYRQQYQRPVLLFQRKSAVGNCDRWFYRKRQVHK